MRGRRGSWLCLSRDTTLRPRKKSWRSVRPIMVAARLLCCDGDWCRLGRKTERAAHRLSTPAQNRLPRSRLSAQRSLSGGASSGRWFLRVEEARHQETAVLHSPIRWTAVRIRWTLGEMRPRADDRKLHDSFDGRESDALGLARSNAGCSLAKGLRPVAGPRRGKSCCATAPVDAGNYILD